MSEFYIEPHAVEGFAASTMSRQQEYGNLRSRMDGVHVPRDAFGYVPGIGGRIYEAYDEFVTGCADSISSASEALAEIAATVRGVVVAYTTSDQAARDSHTAVEQGLSGVDIRGVR
ncbi:hypothetical protein [Planosporangium mesophilum]|uniref:hypothetical protein n=1 Tax=Planosporangium mesophilum TaxID=689768 RepID=UPI0014398EF3|nr:hypothetical protein [Planosporangium mesophilum]NJC85775.1 hypothetical protein [Planosporangium mesophilum]